MTLRPFFHEASDKFLALMAKRFRKRVPIAVGAMLFGGAAGLHNLYLGRYLMAAFQCAVLLSALAVRDVKIVSYALVYVLIATNILDLFFMDRHVRAYNAKHAARLI